MSSNRIKKVIQIRDYMYFFVLLFIFYILTPALPGTALQEFKMLISKYILILKGLS